MLLSSQGRAYYFLACTVPPWRKDAAAAIAATDMPRPTTRLFTIKTSSGGESAREDAEEEEEEEGRCRGFCEASSSWGCCVVAALGRILLRWIRAPLAWGQHADREEESNKLLLLLLYLLWDVDFVVVVVGQEAGRRTKEEEEPRRSPVPEQGASSATTISAAVIIAF